ncbi:7983_t:CDS:2, partial [Dentiscutata erythropus]
MIGSLIESHPIIVKAMRRVYNKNPPPPTDNKVVDLVSAFDKLTEVINLQQSGFTSLAAMDTLLSHTQAWCFTDEQKANILIEASPNFKVKDMRSLAAFYAQNSGVDLSTILAIGNWSSHGIYQQFYKRGVMSMLQKNQVTW